MNKPIGKLLWHKAVRKTATYSAAPDNIGKVVIQVPVIFDNIKGCRRYNITERLELALLKHFDATELFPKPKNFQMSLSATISLPESNRCIATIQIKTESLEDWQWITTGHRFKGGEMPGSLDIKYDFPY